MHLIIDVILGKCKIYKFLNRLFYKYAHKIDVKKMILFFIVFKNLNFIKNIENLHYVFLLDIGFI